MAQLFFQIIKAMKPTRLILFSITLFCSILFFIKCSNESIDHYSLDSVFSTVLTDPVDSMVALNICHYVKSGWSSILIIKPYTDVSEQFVLKELKNFSKVKSKIKDIELGDQVAACFS